MNLLFWKKPETARSIEVVRREAIRLRLSEWRSDAKLVGEAAKMFSQESFRLMLDVLRNENPANLHLPLSTAVEARAIHQARAEGYNMALANLEAMAVASHEPEVPVPDFQPEELPTDNLQTA